MEDLKELWALGLAVVSAIVGHVVRTETSRVSMRKDIESMRERAKEDRGTIGQVAEAVSDMQGDIKAVLAHLKGKPNG